MDNSGKLTSFNVSAMLAEASAASQAHGNIADILFAERKGAEPLIVEMCEEVAATFNHRMRQTVHNEHFKPIKAPDLQAFVASSAEALLAVDGHPMPVDEAYVAESARTIEAALASRFKNLEFKSELLSRQLEHASFGTEMQKEVAKFAQNDGLISRLNQTFSELRPKAGGKEVGEAKLLGRVGEFFSKAGQLEGQAKTNAILSGGAGALMAGLALYQLYHVPQKTMNPETGEQKTSIRWSQATWAAVTGAFAALNINSAIQTVMSARKGPGL